MTKTLHLSHPECDVSFAFSNSILLDNVNQSFVAPCYHTSVGDLSPQDILLVSNNFDIINFIPNGFDFTSSTYYETILLLNCLSHRKIVTGYKFAEKQEFLSLNVRQRPPEPTVWVFGCSHSYGVGLLPKQQNFGQHLSHHTGLPLQLVAQPGASVQWSLRHIMNANFLPGDFVVWQLTSPERISYGYPPEEIRLSQAPAAHFIETYSDQHLSFSQLSLFNQGIQYLRSQPIKFVVISLSQLSPLYYPGLLEYTKHPEFCYIPNYLLDLGTDQLHMGPLSQQALAQHILNHVKYSNA